MADPRALRLALDAARFVAETAAREVDRRWGALEEEAATPAVRADLAEIARQRIATAQGERLRQRLQQFIEELSTEHADLGATSWFLADATGLQWARVPESETIGKSWAFRDYFHGRGRDLPRDQVPADLRPIRAPHRSVVFSSQASGNRIVAFLKGHPGAETKYEIWSFAPQTGSFSEAQRVAFYRAALTRNLLVRAGIAPAQITTQTRITDARSADGHMVRVVVKP